MGVRRWIEDGAEKSRIRVTVRMGHDKGLYHVFWVVPKVESISAAASTSSVAGVAGTEKT